MDISISDMNVKQEMVDEDLSSPEVLAVNNYCVPKKEEPMDEVNCYPYNITPKLEVHSEDNNGNNEPPQYRDKEENRNQYMLMPKEEIPSPEDEFINEPGNQEDSDNFYEILFLGKEETEEPSNSNTQFHSVKCHEDSGPGSSGSTYQNSTLSKQKYIEANPKGKSETNIIRLCPYCGSEFPNPFEWRQHLNVVHDFIKLENLNMDFISDSTAQCKDCNSQITAKSLTSLQQHRITHLPYNRYLKCKLCPEKFMRADILANHLQMVHNFRATVEGSVSSAAANMPNKPILICPFCGNEFPNVSEWRVHINDVHDQNVDYFFKKSNDIEETEENDFHMEEFGEFETAKVLLELNNSGVIGPIDNSVLDEEMPSCSNNTGGAKNVRIIAVETLNKNYYDTILPVTDSEMMEEAVEEAWDVVPRNSVTNRARPISSGNKKHQNKIREPAMKEEYSSWLVKKKQTHLCKVCRVQVSGNATHFSRHAKTEKHKKNLITASLPSVPTIVKPTVESVLKAPQKVGIYKICAYMAEHYESFCNIDHMIPLFKSIATDSNILKLISIDRNEATAKIKEVLAPYAIKKIAKLTITTKYSVMMDETTEISSRKCLAIFIRIVHPIHGVQDALIGILEICDNSDAATLADLLTEYLAKCKVEKNNMVALAADNCPTIMSQFKGVCAILKKQCPNLIVSGCVCHLLELCTKYSCNKLSGKPCELIEAINKHFSNSRNRRREFEKFHKYFGASLHKMLSIATTRWLSMEAAVNRLLEQWDALQHYFLLNDFDEEELDITAHLSNSELRANCIFLSFALGEINKVNKEFQSSKTMIHLVIPRIRQLQKLVLRNIFTNTALQSGQSDLRDEENYVSLEDVYCGVQVEKFLRDKKDFCHRSFLTGALGFWKEFASQLMKRMPLNDAVLKAVSNLDPLKALSGEVRSLLELSEFIGVDAELVNSEWRSLPDYEEFRVFPTSFDEFWTKVLNQKDGLGQCSFPNLTQLIHAAMCIPHSTARVERIFSEMVATKTTERNSLSIDTVSSLLVFKDYLRSLNVSCHEWSPDEDLIRYDLKIS